MGFTTTVREHEHITVNENGTRTLNLDKIFEGELDSYPENEIEGKPTKTVFVKFSSTQKMVTVDGQYFFVGGWDGDHWHRQSYEGELVQGPQMYGAYRGTMISAHYDPIRETAYVVEEGDTVIFLGAKFKASYKNWEKRIKFHRIDD